MQCNYCSICLENIYKTCSIFKTNCNHTFHTKCIESWANSTTFTLKCPLCRSNIINLKINNNIILHYYVTDIGWVSTSNS